MIATLVIDNAFVKNVETLLGVFAFFVFLAGVAGTLMEGFRSRSYGFAIGLLSIAAEVILFITFVVFLSAVKGV